LSSDHLKIVQYSLQRDSNAACAALIDHIESIARQAEKSIFGTQAS
jgi:DNA-binding GntR family transcriptional regulator